MSFHASIFHSELKETQRLISRGSTRRAFTFTVHEDNQVWTSPRDKDQQKAEITRAAPPESKELANSPLPIRGWLLNCGDNKDNLDQRPSTFW